MPSNRIAVNGDWREYEVPDSKMPEVLKCLNTNGSYQGACPCCETVQELSGVNVIEVIKDTKTAVHYLKCAGCGETFEDPPVEDNPVEDAVRIVACVNACANLNPEAVPGLVAALEFVDLNCDNPNREVYLQMVNGVRTALAAAKIGGK